MRSFLATLAFIVCLHLIAQIPSSSNAQITSSIESRIIVDIEAEGTVNVDPRLIISRGGISVGEELKPQLTRKAIKQLYKLGLFKDIRIDGVPFGGGIKLIYKVKECPTLSSIKFTGNKKIKTKELREICALKEGTIISSKAIFDGKIKILDTYTKKGYYLTGVEVKKNERDGKLDLEYVISEGHKVRIKSIEISGNNAFSDAAIKAKLKNKEKSWYRSGKFNEKEFNKDKERIAEFYQKRGYPNFELLDAQIKPDKSKKWIKILFTVNEGKRLYIGDVNFEGNKVIGTPILIEIVKFKKGEPYNRKKIDKTLQNLYSLYADRGYIYVRIEPHESVEDSIVNISYKIDEGSPARVRKIIIEGNTKTHEKVIRRELTIFPGDILRRNELIKSQRKVFNLGYFQNIIPDTRQVSEEGDIDLIIKVEEKQAGQIQAGMSYSAEYGLTGNIVLAVPNFRGVGQTIHLTYEKGQKVENINLGFQEPWLFDTPLGFGFSLFKLMQQRRYLYYYEKRAGGNFFFTRPIPRLDYAKGTIMYGLARIEATVDEKDSARVSPIIWDLSKEGAKISSEITFTLVRDSRDNFINPTTGTRNSISPQFAGGILGGNVTYQKYELESSTYHRLFWRLVLMLRGKLGIITPESAPIYEKFVLGGVGPWGLRGYPDWSIGPTQDGNVVGGGFATVFSLELKAVFEQNIYPLVFFDIGNVWNSFREANLSDLKKGIGFGIRMEIPMMGIVGFDFGYGIDRRKWEPHFQIGRGF